MIELTVSVELSNNVRRGADLRAGWKVDDHSQQDRSRTNCVCQ